MNPNEKKIVGVENPNIRKKKSKRSNESPWKKQYVFFFLFYKINIKQKDWQIKGLMLQPAHK